MTTNTMRGAAMRGAAALLAVGAALAWTGAALAQEAGGASAGGSVSVGTEGASATGDAPAGEGAHDGFLVAGKVAGQLSFGGLDPFVVGALELGYVFGGGKFAAFLDVSYTVPQASGSAEDPRVPDGKYKWELWQKELVFQPTFAYRFTGLDPFTPYVGIGPRIYLLETVVGGSAGGEKFPESKERSTKFGAGLPFGAEYALGPGGLFAEILVQYGPLDHRVTGDTNVGAAALWLGYRAVL